MNMTLFNSNKTNDIVMFNYIIIFIGTIIFRGPQGGCFRCDMYREKAHGTITVAVRFCIGRVLRGHAI